MTGGVPLSSIGRFNSNVQDLLVLLFDIGDMELKVLFLLMKHKKSMTTEELAKKLKRDKSNIFRSVQKLVNLGLCKKEHRTMSEGGYYYVYTAIDPETFKMEAERRIMEIKEGFDRIISKFESDVQNMLSRI